MNTLAPTTAILRTAIQSGMSHTDAVSEFVDNSFGEAAGNATAMTIIDAGDGTLFHDQGRGVSDINLLFRLGDGTSRNSSTDIGRFGVGSKFGALTFGTHVTVMTVHGGKFHEFAVDWAAVMETGVWPTAYDGKGRAVKNAPEIIRGGGTIIIVKDLHKGRTRPNDATYVKRLGLRFMPSLLLGKNIHGHLASSVAAAQRGQFKTEINIAESFASFLNKKVRLEKPRNIHVHDKSASGEFGEIPDGDSTIAGIHISYGGRVIKTLDRIGGKRLPSKLFGRVDLAASWKSSLSYNKTEITEDFEELEEAVALAAKSIIDRLSEAEEASVTEKLSAEISNMMDPRFGKMLRKSKEGAFDQTDEGDDMQGQDPAHGNSDAPVTPGGRTKPAKKGAVDGEGFDRRGAFAFEVKKVNNGRLAPSCKADLIDGKTVICRVELNVDVDVVRAAMLGNPGNKPAVVLLCVKALATYITENPDWISRMFSPQRANELQTEDILSRAELIYNEIMTMVRTNADDTEITGFEEQ